MTKRYTLGPENSLVGHRFEYSLLDRGVIVPNVILAAGVVDDIQDDCEITGGIFNGGEFYGGTFNDGVFYDGVFYGGTFNGGEFHYYYGAYYGGTYNDGAYSGDGDHYSGTFRGITRYISESYCIGGKNASIKTNK